MSKDKVTRLDQHKTLKADLELAPHYRELAEIERALASKLAEIGTLEIKLLGKWGHVNRAIQRSAKKLDW